MLIKNQDIAHLRSIVLDDAVPLNRRLASLDRLAASQNLWQTVRFHSDTYVPPGTRARRFAVTALHKLLKSRRFKPAVFDSAVRARLLFLKGVRVGNHLYRLEPPVDPTTVPVASAPVPEITETVALAKVPDVVRDIEAFLEKHK